jgi:hypothetical protein
MWISKERLDKFKAICRDEFGVELSDVEAHERAAALLDLFSFLFVEQHEEPKGRDTVIDGEKPKQVP